MTRREPGETCHQHASGGPAKISHHHLVLPRPTVATIPCAVLAVSCWVEDQTGWPIRNFVPPPIATALSRIQAGPRTVSAAALLPDDPREAPDRIYRRTGAHYLTQAEDRTTNGPRSAATWASTS